MESANRVTASAFLVAPIAAVPYKIHTILTDNGIPRYANGPTACYLSPQRPAIGLYARAGAGLPDIADAKDWIFDGTVEKDALPSDVVKALEANGHAFRDMD